MTQTTESHPYIPTEQERPDWEQLMIDRGQAILEDEDRRTEWAKR